MRTSSEALQIELAIAPSPASLATVVWAHTHLCLTTAVEGILALSALGVPPTRPSLACSTLARCTLMRRLGRDYLCSARMVDCRGPLCSEGTLDAQTSALRRLGCSNLAGSLVFVRWLRGGARAMCRRS